MIIYQVSITIQADVEAQWLHWMKTVHVPDMIATGFIKSYHILEELDAEHSTYCFHYYFENREDFERYRREHAPRLKEDPQRLFPDKFSATRKLFLMS